MILEINIQGDLHFYEIKDEEKDKIHEHKLEFLQWLDSIETSHPFKIYSELVEDDGTVSFSGYFNSFGAEDFISWLNVEKYKARNAEKINNVNSLVPDERINF